tara:strand:+ start:8887 stop:9819 length:933 start_codon:yes stop_codon:yes gene_type:complete
MAFLDNSGDIILDAVLTDTGRMRLAKGDGSFKITKFALGDDEINYALYRNSNNSLGAHPSGSAFFDLEILQSPVLEAFTNNTSLLKHRLVSYVRNDIFYLPIFKLNDSTDNNAKLFTDSTNGNIHVIAVDDTTANNAKLKTGGASSQGVLNGFSPKDSPNYIRFDIGFDTTELAKTEPIDADLLETQIIVELDNRLGTLVNADTNEALEFAFLDDDQVATYVLTDVINKNIPNTNSSNTNSSLSGPFQGSVEFKVQASTSLRTSTALFTKFGTSLTIDSEAGFNSIDSIMRVTGGNTGFSLDIPLRFLKK